MEEALLLGDRVAVMSRSPGRIILDVNVPFERPRHKEVSQTAEFKRLHDELVGALDEPAHPDGP